MSSEECTVRRPPRLRMPALVVILSLAIVASTAQADEDGRKNKIPSGWSPGQIVRFNVAEVFFGDALEKVWEALQPSDEAEDEGTPEQEADSRSDPVAQFFGIPIDEYGSWPAQRRQALKQVHASPERFQKRTLHTLRMMDAFDWVLVERLAPYAVGIQLFAEKAKGQGFSGGNIEVGTLLELEGMGIISAVGDFISTTLKPYSQSELHQAYRIGDYGLLLRFRNGDHTVKWNVTPISRTGRELLNLLGAKPNTEYLHKLGQAFAEHGIGTELWEVTQAPGTAQMKLENKIWEVIPDKAQTEAD